LFPAPFLFSRIYRKISVVSVQSIHAFAEKVALITDGASPIGRAIALQLALQGSFVIVGFGPAVANHRSALDELQTLGTLAKAVLSDITTHDGAATLVAGVENTFGRLDLLVNCLKFLPQSSFENSGESEFDAVTAGFKAAYVVTHCCLPLMLQRPKPRIINVVSRETTLNGPLFDAVQSGIEGFTRSLARSLPSKFRVNAVAAKFGGAIPDGYDAELFPLGRDAVADDAARAALYLLSPEAIGVNGQILEVGR